MEKEKTIFDLMDNNKDKIELFVSACDDMTRSKYILAETKITAILKSIAVSLPLYSVLEEILRDFDYPFEAKNCIQTDVRSVIVLPSDLKKSMALIFCILLDIDKQVISLKDFLRQFYMSGDNIQLGYEQFIQKIIVPFREGIIETLTQKVQKQIEEKHKAQKKEYEEIERRETEKCIGMILARINSDTKLNNIIKDDIIVLCNELLNVIHGNNSKEKHSAYAQLYKMIQTHKPLLIKELERINLQNAFH